MHVAGDTSSKDMLARDGRIEASSIGWHSEQVEMPAAGVHQRSSRNGMWTVFEPPQQIHQAMRINTLSTREVGRRATPGHRESQRLLSPMISTSTSTSNSTLPRSAYGWQDDGLRRSPGQREIALGAPSPSRGQRSRFLETAARRNYHNADTVQDVDEMAQAQALSHLICGSPEPEGAASSDDHPFGI